MPTRRFALPRRTVPPLVVSALASLITALIATGHAAGSTQPRSVGYQPVTGASAVSLRSSTLAATDPADVARALRALGGPDPRAARSSRSEHRLPLHRWVRPNAGPLSSPFGYRWGRLHAGIDLAGPYGSPIVAATDGCITYAGPMSGYGEVMQIRDWDGTETVYGHMSAFVRRVGCVKAGQEIALVGAAGDATGPHLHFEVRISGVPVDPIPFLAKHGLNI